MNMRLKIIFNLPNSDAFLYNGYQDDVLLYFKEYFNCEHIGITDFFSPRKIETEKGIWLSNIASLIVCSPLLLSRINEIVGLPGKQLKIQGNTFITDHVRVYDQETLYDGILLSGAFSCDGNSFCEYEKSPELFSEQLRLNLIDIYKNINNQEEPEDKRFFISLKKGYKKQYILGRPVYRGVYTIHGSLVLCGIFNQCFVTGRLRSKNKSNKKSPAQNIRKEI